jgi:hypothetical protein
MLEALMRMKATVVVLLLSLAAFVVPQPAEAAGLTLTPGQGIVGSEVSIIGIQNYGSGEYQILWGEARQLIAQGTTAGLVNLIFTVPEFSRGKHKVTLRVGGNVVDSEFTVLPSIRVSAKEGYVGADVTVTGIGFNANETGIEVIYGTSAIVSGVISDSRGNWQSTFKIPPTRSGAMAIDAGGATTPATEVENKSFTILSKIDINPAAGGVGTMVTVLGSGFSSSESNIAITYDGLRVKTAIASDTRGSWQSSFYIPTSTKGRHRINSYGEVTTEAAVSAGNFTVSPVLRLELASGQLGDTIRVGDDFWVTGIGFEQNESGIQVTFDGVMVSSGIVADANGSWAVKSKVPLTTRGKHVLGAAGSITRSTDVPEAALVVSPQIEINPTSGGVGADVVVKGTGFGTSQLLNISYDGMQVASGSATDSRGSFTANFKVPKGKSGAHAIIVTDAVASVASTTFKTETIPPPTPKPVLPEAGSKLGFVGNTVVSFSWTAVEDPSGVSYILEISNSPEFTGAMLRKDNLSQTQYTLTKDEALPDGSYYWRVRAVDGAGNEGGWNNGQLFKVGGDWWLLAVMVGAAIALVLIIWRVVVLTRRGWK